MSEPKAKVSRRRFLQTTAGLAAGPTILPAWVLGGTGKPAPSDKITLGVIGVGSRGFNLVNDFLKCDDARIVAICDVDALHYRDRPWGKGRPNGREPAKEMIEGYYAKSKSGTKPKGLGVYSDFRPLCARQDIDAVVVATPDHWHALCAFEALQAGKDIYGEKPITHFFREGLLLYQEVASRKAIFQTGSQQRSDGRFRQVVELVLNGHLGQIQKVEVGLPPGYDGPQGETRVLPPPMHLDYEMWCGPAPKLPYMRARHHRWWRGHRAFGGGVLMDWIGHHNDIAHWALGMDRLGPSKIEAVGWTFPDTDIYNTPQQYEIHCEYTGGVTSTISCKNAIGTKLIGDQGWVYVRRGKLEASDPRWLDAAFQRGPKTAYPSPGHAQNFLDCVKSRRECVAPAEVAHRSITPGHLGYVSHELGRPLRWDAKREQVIDDEQANALLNKMPYCEPWKLPVG